LLNGGGLRILDYSTSPNVIQILWGALFCLPFGFSFTAIRLSTWVAALFGLGALYMLLRDQGVNRRDALIATGCLGTYPIYFMLSLTFMTDVPLLVSGMGATFAFLRALSRQSDRWLWLAVGLACVGVGVRITGTVAPIAMGLTLALDGRGWGRRQARFLWPATALVLFATIVWWSQRHVEVVADLTDVANAPANRLRALKEHALPLLPITSIVTITFAAGALGLALLPVSTAVLSRKRLRIAAAVLVVLSAAVVIVLVAGQWHTPPLTAGQTWWLGELGATEPLAPDYEKPGPMRWWVWIVTTITFASTSVLVARSVRRLDPPAVFLLLQLFGHLALIALLWLFYDRYALVLVPLALALTVRSGPLERPRLAVALVIVMGALSLVGVRDHLQYNRALWSAVAHLTANGIEPAAFDGGYVVNGWLQYAHPERARRDECGAVAVPLVHVSATAAYRISNQARAGWTIVTSIPYTRWLGRSGRVYVLRTTLDVGRSACSRP
jgi:Dolichyl-phosphate-mannose-protein mannosyltransferase